MFVQYTQGALRRPPRTLVMTGGTSGIGRRVIERLLAERAEWNVLLLARPSARSAELIERWGGGRLTVIPVDLASLESTDRACDEVIRRLGTAQFDALALNAGIQTLSGNEVSKDGFELSFAINHLAHFLIAERLLGAIRTRGRIIITASEVHDPDAFCLVGIGRAYWQDPAELADPRQSQALVPPGVERGEACYSASKLMNVMHARQQAREARHLSVVSFNPSVVPGTEIARERNVLQQLLWKHVLPPLAPVLPGARSLERSAGDLLYLLTDASLSAVSGEFVDGRTLAAGSPDSRDAAKIARLQAVSRALIARSRAARSTAPAASQYARALRTVV
jgi:NAD(P)-dependent dehydrogenase (short-subunit alcohol dehydrogenase family)